MGRCEWNEIVVAGTGYVGRLSATLLSCYHKAIATDIVLENVYLTNCSNIILSKSTYFVNFY